MDLAWVHTNVCTVYETKKIQQEGTRYHEEVDLQSETTLRFGIELWCWCIGSDNC